MISFMKETKNVISSKASKIKDERALCRIKDKLQKINYPFPNEQSFILLCH